MIEKKIKLYFEKKHQNQQSQDLKDNKKMFKHFCEKCDSYLPILIMGAGSNKYPLEFLKSGFDIRVIDNNELLIQEYQTQLGDDGYYYQNLEFKDMEKKFSPNSFSGIWIDNSLIFNSHEQIVKYLQTLYYLLDEEGYIFIKFFVNVAPIEINDIKIQNCSEFKINKLVTSVNNLILEKENEGVYIDFWKKINDIIKLELIKYGDVTDLKSYDKPVRIASAIIRKKK